MKRRKIVRLSEKREQENYMTCPFCTDHRKIPVDPNWIEQHLIVVLDKFFKYHVHGPIGDKETMKNFILKIAKEAKIEIEDNGRGEEGENKKNRGREEGDESQIIENKIIKEEESTYQDSTIPDETA